ncbi:methyl-accepting chemotaxis protein [Acuticoccus sediminis]|uniref:methyl-accepting chemotaxis protein n=1 Tax=Acuticoccus sediminis TaxID=2184697 RepID=UPI001CFE0481|nr:methyl-accepting chemotaxis protein [Acuticoccus sediminis]
MTMALVNSEEAAVRSDGAGLPPAPTVGLFERIAHPGRSRRLLIQHRQTAAERITAASAHIAGEFAGTLAAVEAQQATLKTVADGEAQARSAAEASKRALQRFDDRTTAARDAADLMAAKLSTLEELNESIRGQIEASLAAVASAAKRHAAANREGTALQGEAGEIRQLVDLVAEIAGETRILSLNASVEAAHAGREGLGLSLVAEEIRTLADAALGAATKAGSQLAEAGGEAARATGHLAAAVEASDGDIERGRDVVQRLGAAGADMAETRDATDAVLAATSNDLSAIAPPLKDVDGLAASIDAQSAVCRQTLREAQHQTEAAAQCSKAALALNERSGALMTAAEAADTAGIADPARDTANAADALLAEIDEGTRAAVTVLDALETAGHACRSALAAAQTASESLLAPQPDSGSAAELRDQLAAVAAALRDCARDARGVTDGLGRALDDNGKARARLDAFEQAIQRAERIVESAIAIAGQTGALGVDGSLEAARGPSARGFIGVCAEVRDLSRDTVLSAERIKERLTAALGRCGRVGADLDAIAKTIGSEIEIQRAVLRSLDGVADHIASLHAGAGQMTADLAESDAALGEARTAVALIANAATDASRIMEEAGTATRAREQDAAVLAASAKTIAFLADELRSVG